MKERKIYLPQTIMPSSSKTKNNTVLSLCIVAILKLARSRLPEKQKAIYAGSQQYYYINIEKSIATKHSLVQHINNNPGQELDFLKQI